MSIFLSLAPAWLDTLFYIYWFVLIIMLIMDDREPSITLAWLFILLFLPFIGVVFYVFFGRDWKVVAQRTAGCKTCARPRRRRWRRSTSATSGGRPLLRGVGRLHRRAHLAGDHQENVASMLPAASLELYNDGADKYRAPQGGPGRRAAVHPHAVLHLGAGPAHRRARADPARPARGRRRGPHHVRLDGLHLVQEAELKQLKRAGAKVRGRRHRPPAHQLPQPPQDRRHRRRDRLHGRHERRPGVHRRRRPLRHLARHAHAHDRAGGGVPGEAVRGALVGAQEERRRGPLRRAVHAGARPGRGRDRHAGGGGRAGGRGPLERGPPHAHGGHRPGRGVGRGSSRRTSSPTTASTT